MADVEKAVALLSDAGVLDRLKAEAQAEREIERDELLARLAKIDVQDAALGKELAEGIAEATAEVAKHEGLLANARRTLTELTVRRSVIGVTVGQIRGRLSRLADPAIDAALIDLQVIQERARREFRSTTSYSAVDPLTGKRAAIDESNGTGINDILQTCAFVRAQLEALKEAPRPADLPAAIENLLSGPRAALRKLMGV